MKKILFIPSSLKSKAIMWLRCILPAKYLNNNGYKCKMLTKFYKTDQGIRYSAPFNWADVIVTGRFYHQGEWLKYFKKGYEQYNGKMIYDTDDLCWDIPFDKLQKEYDKSKDFTEKLMNEADAITCTNDYLKDQIKNKVEDSNVAVIPNSIDLKIWAGEREKHDKVRIMYTCGGTHNDEIEFLRDVLSEIKEKYGDKVETYLVSPYYKEKKKEVWDNVSDWIKFKKFATKIKKMSPDIGLAPLRKDNDYNLSKSSIKYITYSMAGAASVLEDCAVYNNLDNALLANSKEEWVDAISELVENDKKRNKMIKKAKREVKNKFDINNNGKLWASVIEKLV